MAGGEPGLDRAEGFSGHVVEFVEGGWLVGPAGLEAGVFLLELAVKVSADQRRKQAGLQATDLVEVSQHACDAAADPGLVGEPAACGSTVLFFYLKPSVASHRIGQGGMIAR